MRSAVLCALAAVVLFAAAAHAEEDPCAKYTRCSECVYDAYPPMSLKPLRCSWCESTATCATNASATCPELRRSSDAEPQCSDMQCSAARNTGNIYLCQGGNVAALVFSIELLLLTAAYYFWMRTVHQLPWKYPRIHQCLDQIQAAAPGTTVRLVSRVREMQSACPICHVHTGKTYAPGSVCFWCDVARFAFVPLIVGLGCGVVSFLSLLLLSLRSSFSGWYYGLLLTVPHVVFVAFGAWVGLTQRPVHGDDDERHSAFVSLAIFLRGRNLSDVFELVPGGTADPATGALLPASSPEMGTPKEASVLSEADQHVDTMQALELDTSIPVSFRDVLREAMRSDEYIMWAEQPSPSVILVDMRWLIGVLGGGIVVGLFLLLIASLQPSQYPEALLAPTPMRVAGFVVLIFSGVMLAITLSSLHRHYVLTNKRLLFLTSGLFSSTHCISTELTDIKYASLHGYQELGYTVLSFGWGRAVKPTRRMPRLRTQEFVGIVGVDDLLQKFSENCPQSLDSSGQKPITDQNRKTWRVHLGVLVVAAALAPTVFVSSQLLPSDLSLFGLLIWWFFCAVIAQRGWRVLSTTSAHLNLAKEWGRSYTGRFSLSRLMPSAIGRRFPLKPAQTVRSVAQPQSPTAAAAAARPATEL